MEIKAINATMISTKGKFNAYPLLLFFILFLSYDALAVGPQAISLALLDTGHCIKKLANLNNDRSVIKIVEAQDATRGRPAVVDCEKAQVRDKKYHGYFMLQSLVGELKKLSTPAYLITIVPIQIFDKEGISKSAYWETALQLAKKEKVDFVIAAAGIAFDPHQKQQLESTFWQDFTLPIFLSAGNWGGKIKEKMQLWPQVLHRPNMIVIGDYLGPNGNGQIFFNKSLLNVEIIDYYFPSQHPDYLLTGNSLAVSLAFSGMLKVCSSAEVLGEGNKLEGCLKAKKKTLKISAPAKFPEKYFTY
ncbi:MAG TPA: hypothetical protein VI754_16205 [Bacteriovoracaceae bacterium]|nr:hypothetical protein [Bacteriovoracaceae bacterium]